MLALMREHTVNNKDNKDNKDNAPTPVYEETVYGYPARPGTVRRALEATRVG